MRASIIVVGDELLSGRVSDANGPWLAGRLTALGVRVTGIQVTGDAAAAVAAAVEAAALAADVVVVAGGLGPTDDDGTRAGLAEAAHVPLVEDAAALRAVRHAQRLRGSALDDRRRREARLPAGARILANPEGTAPGVRLGLRGAEVFALPGVAREMRAMFEEGVAPLLPALGSLEIVPTTAIRAAGVREPDVQRLLGDLEGTDEVRLAFYPHEGELEVRFHGPSEAVGRAREEARRRLGPAAFSENRPIEEEVVAALLCLGLTVTTAESLTGGLVAEMLTRVSGASDVFRGGWVCYSDGWKRDVLGVSAEVLGTHGAVSDAVARRMALGARERAGTDAAVSTTGFAGPGDGEGPDGRPIPQGTFFVGLAIGDEPLRVVGQRTPSGRNTVRRRAAVAALDLLRRALASSSRAGGVGSAFDVDPTPRWCNW